MRRAFHRPRDVGAAGAGLLLVAALCLRPVAAQPPPASVAGQEAVDPGPIVTRFLAAAEEYERTFQSLVAEETKVIEVDPAPPAPSRSGGKSFPISSSTARPGMAAGRPSTRDVQSVDGRPLDGRPQRALTLITKASQAGSIERELETIDRETHRHEFNRHLRGFTITQAGTFRERRPAFHLAWVGREQIAGQDVVVLDYRQTAPIPGFALKVPREFGTPSPVHRGRLWLDAGTGQLWRCVWELAWPHPAAPDPLVMIRQESRYAPSRFGILVPERIEWQWLTHFSHPKKGRPSFTLSERATFTYGSFRRFEVATAEKPKALP